MSLILLLSGENPSVHAVTSGLQASGFDVQRVSQGDELLNIFQQEQPVGVVCDLGLPWAGLMPILRRLRAHGAGRKYRLLLYGERPLQATEASFTSLGISRDDCFANPPDVSRMAERLKSVSVVEEKAPAAAPGKRSMLGFLLEGSLELLTFPRLLFAILGGKGSGRLQLDRGEEQLQIFFKEGDLVSLAVNGGPNSLLEMLSARGKVSAEQRKGLDPAKTNFVTLIGAGILSPHEAPRLLKEQAEMVLKELASDSGGTYLWSEGEIPPQGSFSMGLNLPRLLVDGFRKRPPMNLPVEVAQAAPALDSRQRETIQAWSLLPFELRAINQLNGTRTVLTVIQALAGGNEDRERDLNGLMFALQCAGLVGTVVQQAADGVDWESRKGQLEQEFERLKRSDAFQTLGVDQKVSIQDVRIRFVALSKLYHPDRAFSAPPAVKYLMEEIFRRVQEAYEILSDPKRREEYLATKDAPGESIDPRAILKAEISVTQGERFLKNGAYTRAKDFFKEATELNPHMPEYKALLGWATYLADTSQFSAGAKLILDAIQSNPNLDKGYYFLGCIFKARNDMNQAENAFKKAVIVNPKNIEAQRELRLIEMRREPDQAETPAAKKGIFDRFRKP